MMNKINLSVKLFLLFILLCVGPIIKADSLKHLHQAYPQHINEVTAHYIAWHDGSRIPIETSSTLFDKIADWYYHLNPSLGVITSKDIRQERYEPVFRKMYGNSATQVKKNLTTVYWMPNVFGKRFPLRVTTINGVDKKLKRISAELEKLPPSYYKYVSNPAGSFYWRNVEGESYLSSHSFGIAIDINSHYSNYWLWDALRLKRPISELTCQNRIPMKIVQIFAKEGFFWGGHWYYYDTMHFEYRPDLLL